MTHKSWIMLLHHMPTIPKAQRAAARLGCAETFAIIDDQRSPAIRTLWIAEQVGLHSYELREQLGQGYQGRELDDPFAMIYLQAAQCNVQWLTIEQGTPDGVKEIRDDRGQVIVHRILALRDRYDRGTAPISEAAFAAKAVGEVVWLAVVDDQGTEIASAPVKITKIDKDDQGRPASFTLEGDKGDAVVIELPDPANPSGSALVDGEYALHAADLKPDDDVEDDDDDNDDP